MVNGLCKGLSEREILADLLMQRDQGGKNLIMTSVAHRSVASNERFFEIIGEFLLEDQLKKLLFERDNNEKNVFHYALENYDAEVFSFLAKRVNELTDREILADLLIQSDQSGQNLVMTSLTLHSVVSNERFFAIIGEFLDLGQLKKLFLQRDKNKKKVFHYALENYDQEVLNFLAEKVIESTQSLSNL